MGSVIEGMKDVRQIRMFYERNDVPFFRSKFLVLTHRLSELAGHRHFDCQDKNSGRASVIVNDEDRGFLFP